MTPRAAGERSKPRTRQGERAGLGNGNTLSTMGDTAGALENYRHALSLREQVAAADPTNGAARERLAKAYGGLGGAYAGVASMAKGKSDKMRPWREARAWSRKSLDIWTDMRAKGTLSAINQGELDSVDGLIAKCDLELTRLTASHAK